MSMLVDVIVGIPSDSAGSFGGCQLLPAALRSAGLRDWPVRDAGNLQVAIADPERDPGTGIIGYRDLVAASSVVRDGIGSLLDRGERPLVLGGDCTLLIGVVAALRATHPGTGLVFIDGHFDTWPPETSTTGDAADMEMGILLGDGPEILTAIGGPPPLLETRHTVFVGARDHREMRDAGVELPTVRYPDALVVDEPALRGDESIDAAQRATDHLCHGGATGFWVHLDADVLSSDVMPAVDYPQPGGLSWDELRRIVTPLVASPGFRGMSVAILNPALEGGPAASASMARWLREVLTIA